jgi:hypothetical protein
VFAATVAGALAAGGFFAGHTWSTRDVSSSLHAQAKQLEELRGAVDELSRSLSLLAMIRPSSTPSPSPPPDVAAAPAPPREVTPAPAAPAEPRPEEQASLHRAEGMFADATSRGRWTRQDEEALQQIRSEAPDADWLPFMQKLASAINAGRLRRADAEATDHL